MIRALSLALLLSQALPAISDADLFHVLERAGITAFQGHEAGQPWRCDICRKPYPGTAFSARISDKVPRGGSWVAAVTHRDDLDDREWCFTCVRTLVGIPQTPRRE